MFRSAAALPSLARPALASARAPAAAAVACSAPRRAYHEKVIDHYERPRNVGSLNKADPTVGTGLVGAPACGDVMKLQIKVDEATGKIVDARFKTFGCGSAIASSSLVTEMVRGLSLDEAAQIKNSTIASELSLPPVKLHCSMLAEDAIKAAISDFQKKRASMAATVAASSAAAPAGASATA
ncbi:iron-binding protein [Allomyces arbusculus]|nr:iron-binding protein [Allomyces arbusculus]